MTKRDTVFLFMGAVVWTGFLFLMSWHFDQHTGVKSVQHVEEAAVILEQSERDRESFRMLEAKMLEGFAALHEKLDQAKARGEMLDRENRKTTAELQRTQAQHQMIVASKPGGRGAEHTGESSFSRGGLATQQFRDSLPAPQLISLAREMGIPSIQVKP